MLLQAAQRGCYAQLSGPVCAWCRRFAASPASAPVVIVGAGPTGLTLSKLLSQYGVTSLVLERAPTVTKHPQAHFINNRTMEVFRHIQGMPDGRSLAANIAAASPPLEEWCKFIYCESATGSILGEVDHFKGQQSPRMHDISPEPVAHLSQHRLVPMLLECASGKETKSKVFFCSTVLEVRQSGDTVKAVTKTSQGRIESIDCRYLVAADGANSRVRGMLGVPLRGKSDMQHLVNIHFIAPGLQSSLRGREAMLYFVFNSNVIAVLVAHDISKGEFVAQVPYFPPAQSIADFSPEVCKTLLLAAIGQPGIGVDVKSVRTWTMHAEVADKFQVGNAFLAGDAAHRFPPAGGFGMNTGIQDAHNLAWKLAAVLQGKADPGLLSTYEPERRAVALANTGLSVSNWEQALKVPKALGLDPQAAALLQAAVMSRPASLLPQGLVRSVLDMSLSLGRAAGGVRGPLRAWRKKALQRIFEAGESLRLQFPLEDLGFTYSMHGAAVCLPHLPAADSDTPAGSAAQNLKSQQGRGVQYVQNTEPGSRMPHCEIQLLSRMQHSSSARATSAALSNTSQSSAGPLHASSSRRGSHAGNLNRLDDWQQDIISTHDLLDPSSSSLLLLIGQGSAAAIWAAAARSIDREARMFKILQLLNGPGSSGAMQADSLAGLQGITIAEDVSGRWQTLRQMTDDGALLVRPDGHIAWRAQNLEGSETEWAAKAADSLRTALITLHYAHRT